MDPAEILRALAWLRHRGAGRVSLSARRSSHLLQQHPRGRVLGRGASELRSLRARRARPAGLLAGDFGIGLRLSARAASELSAPEALAEFRAFLRRERLYVFTINGFPYGTFHGARVKEGVYLPDWRDPERLRYTDLLADLLAGSARPAGEAAIDGSVSTVPGAFKPALGGRADVDAMVERLLRHVAHLVALRARSRQARRAGARARAALLPRDDRRDDRVLRRATCMAPRPSSGRWSSPGSTGRLPRARCTSTSVSASISAMPPSSSRTPPSALAPSTCRHLHPQDADQRRAPAARARRASRSPRCAASTTRSTCTRSCSAGTDASSASSTCPPPASLDDALGDREWRVHFHVPIFLDRLVPFASTQAFVREVLAIQRERAGRRRISRSRPTPGTCFPSRFAAAASTRPSRASSSWVHGTRRMNLALALRLGRVSNLPTVWTNVLVGAVLAGAALASRVCPC